MGAGGVDGIRRGRLRPIENPVMLAGCPLGEGGGHDSSSWELLW